MFVPYTFIFKTVSAAWVYTIYVVFLGRKLAYLVLSLPELPPEE